MQTGEHDYCDLRTGTIRNFAPGKSDHRFIPTDIGRLLTDPKVFGGKWLGSVVGSPFAVSLTPTNGADSVGTIPDRGHTTSI